MEYLACMIISIAALFSTLASAEEYANMTFEFPTGTTNHGDHHVICTPAKWSDVLIFLLANYVAHAATIIDRPGEPWIGYFYRAFLALLFPAFGLRQGFSKIISFAKLTKDPLQQACRAEALCTLVRSNAWRPRRGKILHGIQFSDNDLSGVNIFYSPEIDAQTSTGSAALPQSLNAADKTLPEDLPKILLPNLNERKWKPSSEKIHKVPVRYNLNSYAEQDIEYDLVYLPSWATVVKDVASNQLDTKEAVRVYETTSSRNYGFTKAVVALAQTIYSAYTLYEARANQIDQFGYAAFGLTVAPYTVMSIVNLVGNLFNPSYASLNFVASSYVDEAIERGYRITGAVGRLLEDPPTGVKCWTGICEKWHLRDDGDRLYTMKFFQQNPSTSTSSTAESWRFFRAQICERRFRDSSDIYGHSLMQPSLVSSYNYGARARYAYRFLLLATLLAPLYINAAISGFSSGQSTDAQRGWTMSWLAANIVIGSSLVTVFFKGFNKSEQSARAGVVLRHSLLPMIFGIPAIGGYVAVIQMLLQFGSCTRYD